MFNIQYLVEKFLFSLQQFKKKKVLLLEKGKIKYFMVNHKLMTICKEELCTHQRGKFCDPAFGFETSSNFSRINATLNFSKVNQMNTHQYFIYFYTLRIHVMVFSEPLLCVNFYRNFHYYLPDMDVKSFGQGEAKVWCNALKIFRRTGWLFSRLVSSLFQICVNCLWFLHLGFTLCFSPHPFLLYSRSLPPPSTRLLFPLGLCLPNWRYNPTKEPPQNPKTKHKSHKQHAISLVFAAITLFAVLEHYVLFLPGSRAKQRHSGSWDHPTPFLLNIALHPLSSPTTSTKHPGWRDTGQWGPPWAGKQVLSSPGPSGIATAPMSFFPLTEKCNSSS